MEEAGLTLSQPGVVRGGSAHTHTKETVRSRMYVLLFKAHEGIWRVCFFPPLFLFSFFPFFLGNWLHKKASCEPSSLNEKHVAGIQNSGVFQRGPGRHLFLVCTAKSWSRGEGLWWKWREVVVGKRKRRRGGGGRGEVEGFLHGCLRGCE